MYIMLLTVYWSSFSAIVACTFNRHMIDHVGTRMNRLNGLHVLSSAIKKKESETRKVQCGSLQLKL